MTSGSLSLTRLRRNSSLSIAGSGCGSLLIITLTIAFCLTGCAGLNSGTGASNSGGSSNPTPPSGGGSGGNSGNTTTLLYIADGSGNVVVINPATDSLVNTIPLAGGLSGIAISPDGSRAYVTNSLANNVSVIDTKQNSVIATVSLGPGAACCTTLAWAVAVAPDGKSVSVSNLREHSVSILDTATNQVVKTIPVDPNPWALNFSADGKKIYVASIGPFVNVAGETGKPSISVIDVATQTVIKSIPPIGAPNGVAASPTQHLVYVVEQAFGLTIISTDSDEVVNRIPFGDGNMQGGIAVSAEGRFIYVTDAGVLGMGTDPGPNVPSRLFIIDAASNSVVNTLQNDAPGFGEIALSQDGRQAYILGLGSFLTFDVQAKTFSPIAVGLPLSIPNGIAVLTVH